MINQVREWVLKTEKGMTLKQARKDYDGCCIDFSGDFIDANGYGRLAYFEGLMHPLWRYHAAVEIDGLIHDLWIDEILPPEKFLELLWGSSFCYPAEEEELQEAETDINIRR